MSDDENRHLGTPRRATDVEKSAMLRKVKAMFGVEPVAWTDGPEPTRIVPNREERRRDARRARRSR